MRKKMLRLRSLVIVTCGFYCVYHYLYVSMEPGYPGYAMATNMGDDWLEVCSSIQQPGAETETERECNVLKFIEKMNKYRPDNQGALPHHLLRDCNHVFYNRVPKCGSQSLYEAFSVLGDRYNYTVKKKAKGMGRDPSRRPHKVEPYLRSVQHLERPQVTTKHIYFVDFVRTPVLDQPLVMVNVIRDPVDQVVSIYSWRRWGDSVVGGRVDPNLSMDLDNCLKHGDDINSCITWEMTSLPFLCEGNHTSGNCWEAARPTEANIQRAKWHISHTFLAVGITEDLPAFVEVLETLIPHLFCNLTQVYQETATSSLAKYKSVKKEELSEQGLEILKEHLAPNYDLYYFVRQRFYSMLSKIRRHRTIMTTGLHAY